MSGSPAAHPHEAPLHVLHVFPSLEVGGVQTRFATIVNALGPAFRHTVVSLSGQRQALDLVDGGVVLQVAEAGPGGVRAALAALRRIRPGRLVTYNWGAIEWAMANRLGRICPGLHVEDGFGPDETPFGQKARRVWFRRLALWGRTPLIVPSRLLERVARQVWRLPQGQIRYIPNGVDLDRFRPLPHAVRAAPVAGYVGALRREKNLRRLIDAVALVPGLHLELAGTGPEGAGLEAHAAGVLGPRARFLGHQTADADLYARFDLFALSSDTEQMPMTVLEAMACGLPVAATDVGDIAAMVAPSNRAHVSGSDAPALAASLAALSADPDLRALAGADNLEEVRNRFGLEGMIRSWRDALLI